MCMCASDSNICRPHHTTDACLLKAGSANLLWAYSTLGYDVAVGGLVKDYSVRNASTVL